MRLLGFANLTSEVDTTNGTQASYLGLRAFPYVLALEISSRSTGPVNGAPE